MYLAVLLILKTSLAVHDYFGRLSTIEVSRHLPMRLLTLVTASRRLSLTGRRSTTSSYPLVVGAVSVGEGRENGC